MAEKSDIRIMISFKEGGGYSDYSYLTLEANITHMTPEGIRNFGGSRYDREPGSDLAELIVSGQASNSPDEGFYGLSHEYKNVYAVDLWKADSMAKCLRRIQRRMEAIATKYGSPRDAGTYLAHFADAVGCTSTQPFGFRTSDNARWDWGQADGYSWSDVSQMTYRLSDQLAAFRTKHGINQGDA